MLPIPMSLIPKTKLALLIMAVVLGLLCWALWLRGDVADARSALAHETAAHDATRHELAQARTAGNLLLADQRSCNATIAALSRQVNATQTLYSKHLTEEAARRAMLSRAITRPRTAEEAAKVVDNATRHAAADMLNAW